VGKENQRDDENEDMEKEGNKEGECGEQKEDEIRDDEEINMTVSENESVFSENETMDIEGDGGDKEENNKIEKRKKRKINKRKRRLSKIFNLQLKTMMRRMLREKRGEPPALPLWVINLYINL
jgi:hypothetical protein